MLFKKVTNHEDSSNIGFGVSQENFHREMEAISGEQAEFQGTEKGGRTRG